ncbi:8305_t:CDS:1, partial [Gigaspora margarita]
DLYVYAVETSFVDSYASDKKKVSGSGSSQTTLGLFKSVRSKLLMAHQNASGNNVTLPVDENYSKSTDVNQSTVDPVISCSGSSIPDVCSSKHARVEDEVLEYDESDHTEDKRSVKKNKRVIDEDNGLGGNIINEIRRKGRSKR